jgi:hypothetical protein
LDGKDLVPGGLRDLHHAAELGNANVVIEHVDAFVSGRANLDHCGDIGSFARVGAMCHCVPALAFDDGHGLFGGGLIDIGAEHACALARECDRRRLAVSPARPD